MRPKSSASNPTRLGIYALASITFLLTVACAGPQAAPAPEATAEPSATPQPPPANEGFSPVSSREPSAGGETIEAPGAAFSLPAAWEREQPAMTMRLAQARVPGSAGPGQLTVFFFGPGGGGGVEANLQRWIGQVEASEAPIRETFETGPFRVTWVDVAGTIKPSTMGVGPSTPQPDSRLLAAVVEGAGGPWFFKLTGPDDTLAEQRSAFVDMLKSARAR